MSGQGGPYEDYQDSGGDLRESRGNGIVSRMWSAPASHAQTLSTPSPKPPCEPAVSPDVDVELVGVPRVPSSSILFRISDSTGPLTSSNYFP